MSGVPTGQVAEDDGAESGGGAETLIDILTDAEVPATNKSRLVQKVLRQLIETYGFDRKDIRTRYRSTAKGKRQQSVDIAIFRHGEEGSDEHVERVIVCQPQKPREKLRSPGTGHPALQIAEPERRSLEGVRREAVRRCRAMIRGAEDSASTGASQ